MFCSFWSTNYTFSETSLQTISSQSDVELHGERCATLAGACLLFGGSVLLLLGCVGLSLISCASEMSWVNWTCSVVFYVRITVDGDTVIYNCIYILLSWTNRIFMIFLFIQSLHHALPRSPGPSPLFLGAIPFTIWATAATYPSASRSGCHPTNEPLNGHDLQLIILKYLQSMEKTPSLWMGKLNQIDLSKYSQYSFGFEFPPLPTMPVVLSHQRVVSVDSHWSAPAPPFLTRFVDC